MPADVYQPDADKITTVKWLGFFLGLAVLFSVLPVVAKMYLNLQTAPGWARVVLLMAGLQIVYIAWMLNAPDWASVWVVMLVFASVSAVYGTATAAALATPVDRPMLLGMEEVRFSAATWCGAVLAVMALATYLCGRLSAKWRRSWEFEVAGRGNKQP